MAPLLLLLALLRTDGEAAVQQALAPRSSGFAACLVVAADPPRRVDLRFRVNAAGQATESRLGEDTPVAPQLERCLLSILAGVHFPKEAGGREVVYPIHYAPAPARASGAGPRAGSPPNPRPRANTPLRILQEPRLVGDNWRVVDGRNAGISDGALALLAGDTGLQAELASTRSRLGVFAASEFALAAGGAVAAGFGIYGATQQTAAPLSSRDTLLISAGGAVFVIAGSLFLYHVARWLDVGASRPLWHHLDLVQSETLVAQINGGS